MSGEDVLGEESQQEVDGLNMWHMLEQGRIDQILQTIRTLELQLPEHRVTVPHVFMNSVELNYRC